MNEVFFGNTPDSELKSARQRELKGQYLQGFKDGYETDKPKLAEILDKISAEIKGMEYHMIDCDVLVSQEEVLEILEKYKGDKE